MTFRSLLPKELLINSLPLVIQHISGRGVVCTYAACCVEKLVGGGMVSRPALQPHAAPALHALFACVHEHNEYVMKGNAAGRRRHGEPAGAAAARRARAARAVRLRARAQRVRHER
ncbi:hypothetical protein O0L34_g3639 [Tuta absoluta]|nr:hypothetical protein O0L34_g3639 [Tuta absoluta]